MREAGWRSEEFDAAHEGRVAAVLDDGTEPRPVIFDTGSGSHVHRSSDWRLYDGSWAFLRAPRAVALRAVCACGWTGEPHPVERALSLDAAPSTDDGPGRPWEALPDPEVCHADWTAHIGDVERAALPLPDAVAHQIDQLTQALHALADDAPLAALRAVNRLERILADVGELAAAAARQDHEIDVIARGLGLPEEDARTRLAHHAGW
ncbi:hypothetical protein OG216_45470 [Streptomycetaceae bacterium NBC_01309]